MNRTKQITGAFLVFGLLTLFRNASSIAGEDNGITNPFEDLQQMRGGQAIERLEMQHANHPDNLADRLNLGLLYALSSVLDPTLDQDEVERRKKEAVQLVEPEFNKELSKPDSSKVRALHIGFILAQIHLTLSNTGECERIFNNLTDKFPGDVDAENAITEAKKQMELRIQKGYPHDAENPWEPHSDK